MKKLFITMITVLLVMVSTPVTAMAKNLNFGVEAGYFGLNDSKAAELYGSGSKTFGVNAAYRFFKNVSLQTGFNFFSADGKTALSDEDIAINLKTLRIGSYYHFNLKKVKPKAGAGLAMTWYKEDDPFGGSDEWKTGWFVGAGLDIKVAKKFLAGLDLLYNDTKLSGEFGSQSIGGISLLLNLKLEI